jgi:hypothetical protein
MGYTHNWTHKRKITDSEIGLIKLLVNKLINNLPEHSYASDMDWSEHPINIAYEDDRENDSPEVSDIEIHLNGVGDMGHETFYFIFNPTEDDYNEGYKQFCKTARKPYDYVVQAILMIVHKFAKGAIKIGSDGTPNDWEWSRKTASDILGIQLIIPVK